MENIASNEYYFDIAWKMSLFNNSIKIRIDITWITVIDEFCTDV